MPCLLGVAVLLDSMVETATGNATIKGQAGSGKRGAPSTPAAVGDRKPSPATSRKDAADPSLFASSTKKVTAAGAKVPTISAGTHFTVSKEPSRVTVRADPASSLGLSFGNGGLVRQVAPKGQAAARGVHTGWRLTEINAATTVLAVTATSTPKDVLEALAGARKRGKPYTIDFCLTEASGSGARGEQVTVGPSTTAVTVVGANAATEEEEEGGGAPEAADKEAGIVAERKEIVEGGDECTSGVNSERGLVGETAVRQEKGVGSVDGGLVREGGDGAAVDVPDDGGDGEATLMYEMYNENFPIKDGCVAAADIDETYCLSFVMPNCTLHLGPMSPSDRYVKENAGEAVPYLSEKAPGIFQGLKDGGTYWVYVSRDAEEEEKDRERMRQVVRAMQQDMSGSSETAGERKDDGRNGLESCSCVYGNPCVDEYGCKDWHSRFAVAKANGWKGF